MFAYHAPRPQSAKQCIAYAVLNDDKTDKNVQIGLLDVYVIIRHYSRVFECTFL